MQVHGITNEFLAQQPRFADVVDELIEFISGAELIIHNAAFDIAFLDAELEAPAGPRRARCASICTVIDTLPLARQMHPGQRNSLDALCKRYGVDNSHRELHGALLDAQILLDVYLAMTGGQTALMLGEVTEIHVSVSLRAGGRGPAARRAARRACERRRAGGARARARRDRQDQRRQDRVETTGVAAADAAASACRRQPPASA